MLGQRDARQAEVDRYAAAYRDPAYALGKRRRAHITQHLNRIEPGSLLDVSTGRGEVLEIARHAGHRPVLGTEAVKSLCDGETVVHALGHALPFPDNAFDTVTMFDVLEHLLSEDTEAVCRELMRVARKRVLLTVHNGPHVFRGSDLHINRRDSYAAWTQELQRYFAPGTLTDHGLEGSISAMYEVVF